MSSVPRRFIGGADMSANITAPSVRTLNVSNSAGMSDLPISDCSPRRRIPVRRQEWPEHRDQLLRRLLCDPVSAVGNDLAFHVVSNQPHRVRHAFADALASADGENGQRQLALLALRVLRDGDVDRSIRRETATE